MDDAVRVEGNLSREGEHLFELATACRCQCNVCFFHGSWGQGDETFFVVDWCFLLACLFCRRRSCTLCVVLRDTAQAKPDQERNHDRHHLSLHGSVSSLEPVAEPEGWRGTAPFWGGTSKKICCTDCPVMRSSSTTAVAEFCKAST